VCTCKVKCKPTQLLIAETVSAKLLEMKSLIRLILTSTVLVQLNIDVKAIDTTYQNSKNRIISEYSFLNKYRTATTPIVDTTNFDNHRIINLLTEKQITLLSLTKVLNIQQDSCEELKVGVNYLLDLSPNFKTIVFYYYPNEHEIYSVLVNYDSAYKMIDFKTIAMDEIAESFFRTVSRIEKNRITITNFKYFNETIEETEIVNITEHGEIKPGANNGEHP
jgi:hypothetical protein